jgi:hypothetical protein
MAAGVEDMLVSTEQFCSPKSGFTCPYICLVCSHAANFCSPTSRINHVSRILGAVCGGPYCEATDQVSQIGHLFSILRY